MPLGTQKFYVLRFPRVSGGCRARVLGFGRKVVPKQHEDSYDSRCILARCASFQALQFSDALSLEALNGLGFRV